MLASRCLHGAADDMRAFAASSSVSEIPAEALSFRTTIQSIHQSLVNVYGRVENLTGVVVYEFEDQVVAYGRDGGGFASGTHFLYQKQLPLRPGRYKATVVVGEACWSSSIAVTLPAAAV